MQDIERRDRFGTGESHEGYDWWGGRTKHRADRSSQKCPHGCQSFPCICDNGTDSLEKMMAMRKKKISSFLDIIVLFFLTKHEETVYHDCTLNYMDYERCFLGGQVCFMVRHNINITY